MHWLKSRILAPHVELWDERSSHSELKKTRHKLQVHVRTSFQNVHRAQSLADHSDPDL